MTRSFAPIQPLQPIRRVPTAAYALATGAALTLALMALAALMLAQIS